MGGGPLTRVVRRDTAERDLDDVWLYIADDNPEAADRQLDRFREKLGLLAERPGLGRSRPKLGPELRSFTVGRYVLWYQPIADGIELIRVLHGSRSVDRTSFD